MLQFLRGRDPAPPTLAKLPRSVIADAVRSRLDQDDGAMVRAMEVGCADPGCPDAETIVVLMVPGRRSQAAKVPKPMRSLDDTGFDDLAAQLVPRCGRLSEARR